jgi:hypothetical protein
MKGGNFNNFKIIIVAYLVITGFIIYKIYQIYKYGFVGYAKKRIEKRQRRADNLKNLVDDLNYN